jgi:hypothetical protein
MESLSRVTLPRDDSEPIGQSWPSDLDSQWDAWCLRHIIANAVALIPGRSPVTEYLMSSMDWYVAKREELRPQEPAPLWEDWSLGADPFEEWLVERLLRQVRSEAWAASAEAVYLRAEWERSR